ncbi:hypothetical protein [Micromonospora eburnea]|uniref:Uncharacterized protein n=1 Tax=Micromonospora eburnea TaxID=227316 RepID=A0A1C6VJX7_9ACTN|nr:hypothetical protein [Micromonospora eburnea]SCL66572.1 hypothetical protein GA0070604_5728 [Micromonospora eburnea]
MSITRTLVITTVKSALVVAAAVGFGAVVADGPGQQVSQAIEACPEDTHWSDELVMCVTDTHW